jgi:hypothetical protein
LLRHAPQDAGGSYVKSQGPTSLFASHLGRLLPALPCSARLSKKMPARFEPGGHLVSYRNFIVPISTRLLLERIALCLVDYLLRREDQFVSLLGGIEGIFVSLLAGIEGLLRR